MPKRGRKPQARRRKTSRRSGRKNVQNKWIWWAFGVVIVLVLAISWGSDGGFGSLLKSQVVRPGADACFDPYQENIPTRIYVHGATKAEAQAALPNLGQVCDAALKTIREATGPDKSKWSCRPGDECTEAGGGMASTRCVIGNKVGTNAGTRLVTQQDIKCGQPHRDRGSGQWRKLCKRAKVEDGVSATADLKCTCSRQCVPLMEPIIDVEEESRDRTVPEKTGPFTVKFIARNGAVDRDVGIIYKVRDRDANGQAEGEGIGSGPDRADYRFNTEGAGVNFRLDDFIEDTKLVVMREGTDSVSIELATIPDSEFEGLEDFGIRIVAVGYRFLNPVPNAPEFDFQGPDAGSFRNGNIKIDDRAEIIIESKEVVEDPSVKDEGLPRSLFTVRRIGGSEDVDIELSLRLSGTAILGTVQDVLNGRDVGADDPYKNVTIDYIPYRNDIDQGDKTFNFTLEKGDGVKEIRFSIVPDSHTPAEPHESAKESVILSVLEATNANIKYTDKQKEDGKKIISYIIDDDGAGGGGDDPPPTETPDPITGNKVWSMDFDPVMVKAKADESVSANITIELPRDMPDGVDMAVTASSDMEGDYIILAGPENLSKDDAGKEFTFTAATINQGVGPGTISISLEIEVNGRLYADGEGKIGVVAPDGTFPALGASFSVSNSELEKEEGLIHYVRITNNDAVPRTFTATLNHGDTNNEDFKTSNSNSTLNYTPCKTIAGHKSGYFFVGPFDDSDTEANESYSLTITDAANKYSETMSGIIINDD